MTVSLSLLAGAGWQFFDDNGNPLSGGLLYTYEAGTTTPQATYTDSNGNVANSNPIVLDAAGRVPYQVWLTDGASYKFILKTSLGVTVWTEDDIPAGVSSADVSFLQAGAGAVTRTVQSKLRDVVSAKDFGAVGNGVTDDTAAIQAALNTGASAVFLPQGTYKITSKITVGTTVYGTGPQTFISLAGATAQFELNADRSTIYGLTFVANATMSVPAVEVTGYKAFWSIYSLSMYNGSGSLYDGIKISDGLSGTINQCRVDAASNIGIHVTNPTLNFANAISISDCRVRNCGVSDFKIENAFGGSIMGCVSEGTGPIRYHIKTSSVDLVDCYAEGAGGTSTTSISYKLEGANGCRVLANSSHAAKSFWLTGNASNNYICGSAFEVNDSIYEVDSGCVDNTFFWGGYIPFSKIIDNGTRTTIFVNGSFFPGSTAAPGLRFDRTATAPNTGFYATSLGVGASVDGNAQGEFRTPGANEAALLLRVDRAGVVGFSRVSIGAVDSGGVGFRLLRVAN